MNYFWTFYSTIRESNRGEEMTNTRTRIACVCVCVHVHTSIPQCQFESGVLDVSTDGCWILFKNC